MSDIIATFASLIKRYILINMEQNDNGNGLLHSALVVKADTDGKVGDIKSLVIITYTDNDLEPYREYPDPLMSFLMTTGIMTDNDELYAMDGASTIPIYAIRGYEAEDFARRLQTGDAGNLYKTTI